MLIQSTNHRVGVAMIDIRENREAIASLERIYGVKIETEEDLRRLARQTRLPVELLALGIEDLRFVRDALSRMD